MRGLTPPGGPLDIATKPDARGRVRSKSSSTSRPGSKAAPAAQVTEANGKHAPGLDHADESVGELQQMLAQTERERARASELLVQAEEDLDTAHQRLGDADVARRHLLDNVASGGG